MPPALTDNSVVLCVMWRKMLSTMWFTQEGSSSLCLNHKNTISKSRSSLQIFFQRLLINFLAYLHDFGTKICRNLVFIHMAHTWIDLALAKHFFLEIMTPANCWQPCFFFPNVMMTHHSFCRLFWEPGSFCVDGSLISKLRV